jgi:hypothetical protein
MKDHAFMNNPHIAEEIKVKITAVGVRITKVTLTAVMQNFSQHWHMVFDEPV